MIVADSRLYVVDRDPAIRQALSAVASKHQAKLEVHRSVAELMSAYAPSGPACLAIDVTTIGGRELAALDALGSRHDPIAVIALSAMATVSMAVRALKAGAIDFIEKPCRIDHLVDAVAAALAMAQRLYDRQRECGAFEKRLADLSARQREILQHIVMGKANKVIAYELGISERTVEVHRYRLLRRMAVGSAVELARLVGMSGALPDGECRVRETPNSSVPLRPRILRADASVDDVSGPDRRSA